jgi:hypothetical protein
VRLFRGVYGAALMGAGWLWLAVMAVYGCWSGPAAHAWGATRYAVDACDVGLLCYDVSTPLHGMGLAVARQRGAATPAAPSAWHVTASTMRPSALMGEGWQWHVETAACGCWSGPAAHAWGATRYAEDACDVGLLCCEVCAPLHGMGPAVARQRGAATQAAPSAWPAGASTMQPSALIKAGWRWPVGTAACGCWSGPAAHACYQVRGGRL